MGLPHTLLITGGTSQAQREYAEKLARDAIPTQDLLSCGDFLEVDDPETNTTGIEKSRQIKEWIATKPLAQKKVVFIHNAEKLTVEAQNALLKTLEEPPLGSIIILSTQKGSLLLPTVLSRCGRTHLGSDYDFTSLRASSSEIVTLLKATPGEKFDWCAAHTKLFKDDLALKATIETWMIVLRDLLLVQTMPGVHLNLPTVDDTRHTAADFDPEKLLTTLESLTEALEKIERTPVDQQLLMEVTLLSI